ncbi:sugar nucleotide-binding protein [Candidatus Gottesmanbacteria bacterium]|nr:sugar nucleotide-binding protein [Candidatus Gottesmanbacteria bacterium]
MKVLLTGASGMVGTNLQDTYSSIYDLLVPSHDELDIVDSKSVMVYVAKHIPDVIIHAAGVTDPKKAESERGDEGGRCFRTNVLGTRYIKEASDSVGAFFIHISTGSVFFGNDKNSGPFSENTPLPESLGGMSWYGWTKVLAEKEAGKKSAIVRLSKPLQKISFARPGLAKLEIGTKLKRDFLGKLLDEYKNHTLAGLMTDQYFPIVSMGEVVQLLTFIINHKRSGVYHAASPDMTTPFELLSYVLGVKGKVLGIKRQRFDEFIKTQELPLRHQKYSAIDSQETMRKTGMRFLDWKKVVESAVMV